MNDLKKILQGSLDSDTSVVVSFDNVLPNTTIRIHDSRTMIVYGIGREDKHGLALAVTVDNNSKKGKKGNDRILELVNGFGEFVTKRSVVYVKDYGVDIDKMITDIETILGMAAADVKFSVARVDAGSNA